MSFIYFLPLSAALLWGLSYAVFEKALEHVSIATFMLVSGAVSIVMAYPIGMVAGRGIDFSPIKDSTALWLFLATLVSTEIANLSSIFAVRFINATYASIGEIAYPVFTVIFTFLLFKENNFNWWTIASMALVITGVSLLIFGEYIFGDTPSPTWLSERI